MDKEISEILALSDNKLDLACNIANNIIESLPPQAINQLLEGYNNDIDRLLTEIFLQTKNAINFGGILDSEKLSYLSDVEMSMDQSLKKLSFNYFKTTMLPNFRQGWRNLEWGNLVQLYPFSAYLAARASGKSYEFSVAFSLWRLYTYDRPNFLQRDTPDNQNRKETCLIANTATLAKEHIDKIEEEIRLNDGIKEKLNPRNLASLTATAIETETGSKLHLRGKDGFIRGLHVGACICDDLPDESSIYSTEQREKLLNIFKGAIAPIVEPYGYLVVDGTPYSETDLYYSLKQDKKFKVFEYPAIFPDGRLLSPDRFTFEKLMEEKESAGSLVFSREYLVVPISDSSTIFPMEFLMRSTIGMERVCFATNIESYPFKMKRVVMGCDLAISGTVSADFSVSAVIGEDMQGNYHLIHLERHKGSSHNEQVERIVSLDRQFRPNVIVVENNGFQRILAGLVKERGLRNIKEFTTTAGNKKSLREGWPSLAAFFERGQLRVPYLIGPTQDLVKIIFGEFNSIAFRSDKNTLEAVGNHDDIVSAIFMAVTELRGNKAEIKIDLV